MGLLKHLLFWPVTGPTALARFALRQVEKTAYRELTDQDRVREELMEAQLLLELGEIDEEEYRDREAELMERLQDVRRWREHLGMEPTWGPVAVSGSEEVQRRPPEPSPPSSGGEEDPTSPEPEPRGEGSDEGEGGDGGPA